MSSKSHPPKRGCLCAYSARVPQRSGNKISSGKRLNVLSWDDYFMATAMLSAKRSKVPNSKCGACIVDHENRIVGIGYNSFPSNVKDDEFLWTNENENIITLDPINDENFYIVHAEVNAIFNKKTASLKGTRIYTTQFPCSVCTKLIIQSGMNEVIYLFDKNSEKPTFRASKRMLDAANIRCIHFIPLTPVIKIDFTELIQEELNMREAADVDLKNRLKTTIKPTETDNKTTEQEPQ